MTIRRRLLLLLLPALAILMLCGGLVDRWVATATTQDAYDQALGSTAIAAAAFVQVADGAIRFNSSPRTIAFLHGNTTADIPSESRLYAVTGPGDVLIAGSAGLAALRAPANAAKIVFSDATFQGRRLRLATVLLPTPAGPATIMVAETRERRERTQHVMLFGKLMVDFAELDLTLLVVWIAVYFGLRPLGWLRDEAEAHSRRELRRFDESRVPGELRAVVVAFNRVLEMLHDASIAQRRFVADAAHQMRTPVAGLLAQLELLLAEPRAEAIAAELAVLQRGVQSLAHSANQLLALARAEPVSALHENFQSIDLEALVKELVERHLRRADQAGIDLGAETCAISVAGDAWLLEDLLGNLIDNALKYTPPGGHVTVRSSADGAHPYLEVEDDGPGIPEPERRRVRERFYRRPGSPGIGAGLGLAIVDEIARAHEATLAIGTGQQGHGTRMRVRFRAADVGALT